MEGRAAVTRRLALIEALAEEEMPWRRAIRAEAIAAVDRRVLCTWHYEQVLSMNQHFGLHRGH